MRDNFGFKKDIEVHMAKNKKMSTEELLIDNLKLNIGNISETIEQKGAAAFGSGNMLSMEEIEDYATEFLELFVEILQKKQQYNKDSHEYQALIHFFNNCSEQIQIRGGTLEEFVAYMHFLQTSLIEGLQADNDMTLAQYREVLLMLASLFNDITLQIFNIYLGEKEYTIKAQQEELLQTSTPITEIWDGVLTLPIIGSLDSSRTMVVMEKLLNKIEDERSRMVVIDVTGVITIDSQVAHHLIQMMRAIKLMGAMPILTGIRPDIARALTNLNIDLGDVVTRATLSEGLKEAFRHLNIQVSSRDS
jgi:rsbT co-antagonist protein RsbR